MMILRLALRNLLGAGLRTWLNAAVLSLVFLAILTAQALLKGMYEQTESAMVATEFGGGQLLHPAYDRYDPLTIADAHGPVPPEVGALVAAGRATAVLVVPGTIYPAGRMQPVLLKGIDPDQEIVDLPAHILADGGGGLPVLLGGRMAEGTGLRVGDTFTVQWRDRRGTFDAREARVAGVFRTQVQSVDRGQLWLPLDVLQAMTEMEDEATLATLAPGVAPPMGSAWLFQDLDVLLTDIRELVRSKMFGSMFVYAILLFLAMLAIFDTRVFAIFKRQREIGTLVAMGMTRRQVARLFTLEGLLNAVLALAMAAAYGWPLLAWFARTGWRLPETTDAYGYALGDVLFPRFGGDVVTGTALVILVLAALVSFLPTRRISRVAPTDALRGRVF
mgnify:CR=1 FL=1